MHRSLWTHLELVITDGLDQDRAHELCVDDSKMRAHIDKFSNSQLVDKLDEALANLLKELR